MRQRQLFLPNGTFWYPACSIAASASGGCCCHLFPSARELMNGEGPRAKGGLPSRWMPRLSQRVRCLNRAMITTASMFGRLFLMELQDGQTSWPLRSVYGPPGSMRSQFISPARLSGQSLPQSAQETWPFTQRWDAARKNHQGEPCARSMGLSTESTESMENGTV